MPLFSRNMPQKPPPPEHPLPQQMAVLHTTPPTLDTDKLFRALTALEPDAPPPAISLNGAAIRWGKLHAAIVHRPDPLPAEVMRRTVGASNLTDAAKSPLRMHSSHTLLSLTGDGTPIERMAALLKLAAALVGGGAIGAVSPATWSAFTPELLALLRTPDFWPRFRAYGVPYILAAGFVKVYAPDPQAGNALWFLSKGHALYGLPELAYRAGGHDEAEQWFDLFANIFHLMMDEGPVIQPGDEMETDHGVLRFTKVPEGIAFLESSTGTLVVHPH